MFSRTFRRLSRAAKERWAQEQSEAAAYRGGLMRAYEDADRNLYGELESIDYRKGWYRLHFKGFRVVICVREDDLKRRTRILEAQAHEAKYPAPLDTDD